MDKHQESPPPEVTALLDLIESVAFTNGVKAVPEQMWQLSDTELEELAAPTKAVHGLRDAFWRAVRRTLETGQKIRLTELVKGVCTYTHAYESVIQRPARIAWLMRPISGLNSEIATSDLARDLLDKLGEIARLPVVDSKGRVNLKNAKLVLQTVTLLEERLFRKNGL